MMLRAWVGGRASSITAVTQTVLSRKWLDVAVAVAVGMALSGGLTRRAWMLVSFVPKTLDIEFRAMRPIKAGQELTQTYGEYLLHTCVRSMLMHG